MLLNEFAGINPAVRVLSITGTDKGREKFSHLEMEMRQISTVGAADGRDVLAAANVVSVADEHRLHVSVERLHVFALAVLIVGVEDDDDVAPSGAALLRTQHATISNREYRIAKIAVFAADSVEIVAEVPVLGERLRVVGERAVFGADWKVEAIRRRQRGEFRT